MLLPLERLLIFDSLFEQRKGCVLMRAAESIVSGADGQGISPLYSVVLAHQVVDELTSPVFYTIAWPFPLLGEHMR